MRVYHQSGIKASLSFRRLFRTFADLPPHTLAGRSQCQAVHLPSPSSLSQAERRRRSLSRSRDGKTLIDAGGLSLPPFFPVGFASLIGSAAPMLFFTGLEWAHRLFVRGLLG